MSLKHKAFKGALWLSAAGFVQKLISFTTTIVLARILEPSVFGMFALAFVVIDWFSLFKSVGLDAALIQRKDDTERAANTAFIIIVATGILIYFILTVSTPLISIILKNNQIAPIIQALGLVFVVNAVQRVPLVLLEKEMKFNQLGLWSLFPEVVFSFFAILFALLGWNIWSLVIAFLIKTAMGTWIVWSLEKWRPKWEFDRIIAKDMFHFGKFIFLSSLIYFIVQSFDKIVISKILDLTTLGLYAIAFNFATLVSSYLGVRVNRVLYPTYAKLHANLYDLKQAYLKILKLMVIISLPLSAGMCFLGGDFLRMAFGEKWIGAIPILHVLSWLGFLQTVDSSGGAIFTALKKPKIDFILDLFHAFLVFSFMIPAGKMFGVIGIAFVVLFKSIIMYIIRTFLLVKRLNIKKYELFSSYQTAFYTTILMSGIILIFKFIATYLSLNLILSFTLTFVVATSYYLFVIYLKEKELINEIKGLLFQPKLT